jgi:hypothetical protein
MARYKSTTYRKNTIYEGDNEFEVNFEPCGDPEVRISEDGMRAVVGYFVQDDTPRNPRKEFDNVGKMICFHRNYKLGDDHRYSAGEDFLSSLASEYDDKFDDYVEWLNNAYYERLNGTWEEKCRAIDEKQMARIHKILDKHVVILPLYLYDHSGITMSTGRFSCPWDSGQVGWLYVDRATMLKEWGGGGKVLTKKIKDQARKYLEGEVETYDQYLTGDVYGVVMEWFVNEGTEDEPEWEQHEEDSCWGYFGHKYAEEEVNSWVNSDSSTKFLETPIIYEDPNQMGLFCQEGDCI